MLGSVAEHLTQARAHTYGLAGYIGFCHRLMRTAEQWRLRGQYCIVCARHTPPPRERHESLDVLAPDLSDYRRDLWKAVSISTTRPFSGSRIDVVRGTRSTLYAFINFTPKRDEKWYSSRQNYLCGIADNLFRAVRDTLMRFKVN